MTESPEDGDQGQTSSPGANLPPGRYEELTPRLRALLGDFAELEKMAVADVEPLPSFTLAENDGDGDD
jgi:hypothetical protein